MGGRIIGNALSRGSGRREEAREHGEGHGVAGYGGPGAVEIGLILGQSIVETGGRGIGSFGVKEFVGDAHFDVVGFTRENRERFILSFPAEASDGAVVAAVVGMTGNSEGAFGLGVGLHVGEDGGVGDIFDQTRAEGGRGDAEDQIVLALHLGEVGLRHGAAGGVAAASDGENVVNAAVGDLRVHRAIGINGVGEAGFAHRSISGDEKGNLIRGAVIVANGGLRILADERIGVGAGAGAADRRLGVAAGTTVGIESGTEAFARLAGRGAADRVNLREAVEAVLKKLELRGRKCRKWLAGIDAASAHAGIAGGRAAVAGSDVGGIGVVVALGMGDWRDRERGD